ncbi:PREDICTED: cytochrome P450 4C1-like [Ceratosolen solmsi marchali]|uniref:Cytochrome P450 4C1-like n=1 Tax=Ceratosolen solmsi marchali TaxID=326594 RepID=A0AAJ6YM77_9HYME|nr:PREDICTED: cytochrome P450 4C1-like [Ceratosolen solmsi marchali]
MEPILLCITFIAGFCLLVIIYLRMSEYFEIRHILGYIPGPKAYPFVGLSWKIKKIPLEDQFKWFNDLCFSFKNGMVVTWLGTKPTVNIRKPRQLQVILENSSFTTKPGNDKILTPWLGNGVFTSIDKIWFDRRRFVKSAYLELYSTIMIEKLEILKECISKELELNKTQTINIFNLVYKYSLDTICEIAFGINLDLQRNEENEYVETLHRIGKQILSNIKIMHNFTEKIIIQKQVDREQNKLLVTEEFNILETCRNTSLLDKLLDVCENTKTPFTLQEIREELDTFIFAGHTTITSAISWAFFMIGNNQNVQIKLQEELKEIFTTDNEPITIQKLEKLQYMDRVIKEVLRLYPSISSFDRLVDSNVVIDNYFIPKGIAVRLHIYQLHHDPEVWEDPETFNPDRFLPENNAQRHPYAYVPFSAGPRNCIGQKFAILEIKIALTVILRKWHIASLLKPSEIKIISNFILKPFDKKIELYLRPINKSESN